MSDHCKGAKHELVALRRAPDYWKSPEDRRNGPPARGEFPGGLPAVGSDRDTDTTRRDFLTLMGFGTAAASVAACRAPEQKAIPLPVATDELIPGVANYYATTCGGCASACSLLVKQRDGRPIKIEGNEASSLFGGATCATGQATVLSLYDEERLRGPVWKGQPSEWHLVDAEIAAGLDDARAKGGVVALLTGTITSPSTRAVIERWRKAFPGFRHVSYDAVSASALLAASAAVFGRPVVPHYAFDRARMIVGLDADFLGTWLSPVEFARQYARGRAPDQPPGLHVQFEPGMSVTGSNADQRVPVAPSQLGAVAAALVARIARKAGEADVAAPADPVDAAVLDSVAGELWKHRGESLVVTGCNDTAIQVVVLTLNRLLGNVGKTLDVDRPSHQRQGDDAAMAALVADMARGQVHTLILHGVNPGYDYADPAAFMGGLAKVTLSISTSDRRDETSTKVHALCPDHHFLESWGDAEPVAGYFSLTQPTIAPLFETRSAIESLMRWLGEPANHYALLRDHWRTEIMPRQAETVFDTFWDTSLEQGIVELGAGAGDPAPAPAPAPDPGGDWRAAIRLIGDQQRAARAA
ncbi:MAG TPA: hypothetical protein VK607_02130, partial [Kofleriaceae bacterium]|nr:hypothetical protein [Kofleriaceae bacterium]